MPKDPLRMLRLRWDDLLGSYPGRGRLSRLDLDTTPPPGAPGFIGRVRDGGAIPTDGEKVFLASPVRFDGIDAEGSGADLSIDESRSIPVVVVGSRAPKAGDLIIAHASGGRWVSQLGGPPKTVACGGCEAPRQNLTLTWTNSIQGVQSSPMTFNGLDEWKTGCINQIVFRLSCQTDGVTFSADQYTDGSCPTGQPTTCSGSKSPSTAMALTIQSCDPFLLQFAPTFCPAISSLGYTRFTITR